MAIPEDIESRKEKENQSNCTSSIADEKAFQKEATEKKRIEKGYPNLEQTCNENQMIKTLGDDEMVTDPNSENSPALADSEKSPFCYRKDAYENFFIMDKETKRKPTRLLNKRKENCQVMAAAFLIILNCLDIVSCRQVAIYVMLIITNLPSTGHHLMQNEFKVSKPWFGKKGYLYAKSSFEKSDGRKSCESQKSIWRSLFQKGLKVPLLQNSQTLFPVFGLTDYFRALELNPTMPKSEKMKYDMLRTSTFSNFPTACPISILSLVKAGFYYEDIADEVTCFSCRVKYRNWKQGDDPVAIHRERSPRCSFLNPNTTENADNENGQTILYARERNDVEIDNNRRVQCQRMCQVNQQDAPRDTRSYVTRESSNQRSLMSNQNNEATSQRIHTGSHCQQNQNIVNENVQTSCTRNAGSDQQRNIAEGRQQGTRHHGNHDPSHANTQRSQHSKTTPSKDALQPLGISIEKPKYPQFAVLGSRISSFENWPKSSTHNSEEMPRAGFIYEGTSDFTRCFFCAGGLRDWELEDNPWIEHARWYPNCTFIRQCRGEDFINLIKQENIQEALDQLEGRIVSAKPNTESDVCNMPAVLSVLEMGYHTKVVENAVTHLSNMKGCVDLKAEDILRFILETEDHESAMEKTSESTQSPCASDVSRQRSRQRDQQGNSSPVSRIHESLIEENRNLREEQICKICMDENIAIVFLPCGHMVTCVNCAPAVRKCPLCRRLIKGTVKAILS
ncbi:hypothetical protein FSP39_021218 [Pinctada imbricata]|uniref:RING-type domain-containing protein n=1 Tax=Pinctada imbricata TaxID=66713 RepID=A0AA89BXT5_PINIB|nr:hypothetical protein FSP39_021218 [Pinctada imbricata]